MSWHTFAIFPSSMMKSDMFFTCRKEQVEHHRGLRGIITGLCTPSKSKPISQFFFVFFLDSFHSFTPYCRLIHHGDQTVSVKVKRSVQQQSCFQEDVVIALPNSSAPGRKKKKNNANATRRAAGISSHQTELDICLQHK